MNTLDKQTRALVGLASAIATGEPHRIDFRIATAREQGVDPLWVDELMLQSVLMVGWPRALIAAGRWRDAVGTEAADSPPESAAEWAARGEETCKRIYGGNYDRLRQNIHHLHPALDAWMVEDGYGRTLSRPGLDLKRREFCVIAQTAVLCTPRQLHSHLLGALRADATVEEVEDVLMVVAGEMPPARWEEAHALWDALRRSRTAA